MDTRRSAYDSQQRRTRRPSLDNVIDVTRFPGFRTPQSPEQWLRSANRFAPPLVAAGLVLLVAWQLAELTWTLAPRHSFDRPPPDIVQPERSAAGPAGADYSVLADSRLFGEPPEEASEPSRPARILDAPETTLSLRLTGVIADEAEGRGQAFIAGGRADEKKYAVGQAIEGTDGATLHSVYEDRVILDRNGRLETLRLPKELADTGRTAARSRSEPQPQQEAREPDETPLRNVVEDNAANLTDIMRMAPHVEGGQMVGFRVNPGRDRETFEALGLQAGDVVTDINGMTLDDPSRALQVFEALGESTQATVTVMRDGASEVMVVDTSQLQSISENRQ